VTSISAMSPFPATAPARRKSNRPGPAQVEGRVGARIVVQDARQRDRHRFSMPDGAGAGEVLAPGGKGRNVEHRPALTGAAIRGQREKGILGCRDREHPSPPVFRPRLHAGAVGVRHRWEQGLVRTVPLTLEARPLRTGPSRLGLAPATTQQEQCENSDEHGPDGSPAQPPRHVQLCHVPPPVALPTATAFGRSDKEVLIPAKGPGGGRARHRPGRPSGGPSPREWPTRGVRHDTVVPVAQEALPTPSTCRLAVGGI
jgi:hypothetical protein